MAVGALLGAIGYGIAYASGTVVGYHSMSGYYDLINAQPLSPSQPNYSYSYSTRSSNKQLGGTGMFYSRKYRRRFSSYSAFLRYDRMVRSRGSRGNFSSGYRRY